MGAYPFIGYEEQLRNLWRLRTERRRRKEDLTRDIPYEGPWEGMRSTVHDIAGAIANLKDASARKQEEEKIRELMQGVDAVQKKNEQLADLDFSNRKLQYELTADRLAEAQRNQFMQQVNTYLQSGKVPESLTPDDFVKHGLIPKVTPDGRPVDYLRLRDSKAVQAALAGSGLPKSVLSYVEPLLDEPLTDETLAEFSKALRSAGWMNISGLRSVGGTRGGGGGSISKYATQARLLRGEIAKHYKNIVDAMSTLSNPMTLADEAIKLGMTPDTYAEMLKNSVKQTYGLYNAGVKQYNWIADNYRSLGITKVDDIVSKTKLLDKIDELTPEQASEVNNSLLDRGLKWIQGLFSDKNDASLEHYSKPYARQSEPVPSPPAGKGQADILPTLNKRSKFAPLPGEDVKAYVKRIKNSVPGNTPEEKKAFVKDLIRRYFGG